MRLLAPGVWQLRGRPPNAINAYVVGDVLVDAGTPAARKRILRELEAVAITAHVVTHAHPDHFGSSHAVCDALDIPLWAGEHDAEAIETATPVPSDTAVGRLLAKAKMPPAHEVARRLREGDVVAGFEVLDVPGHSPGHIALWRAKDRTLVAGDVCFNVPRLGPPPDFLTVDPERNGASMRKIAELEPALALFGHGPPLRDPDRLRRVAKTV
jgi:hydroxyacylglutathione hydrolase